MQKVHPVTSGTQTLKDAVNETMREWTNRVSDTHYVLGSVMGPSSLSYYSAWISRRNQQRSQGSRFWKRKGRLPAAVVAWMGGGSNAMGMFYRFIEDEGVKLSSAVRPRERRGHTAACGYHGKGDAGSVPRDEILFLPG